MIHNEPKHTRFTLPVPADQTIMHVLLQPQVRVYQDVVVGDRDVDFDAYMSKGILYETCSKAHHP